MIIVPLLISPSAVLFSCGGTKWRGTPFIGNWRQPQNGIKRKFIAVIVEAAGKTSFVYSCMQTRLITQSVLIFSLNVGISV